MDFFEINAHCNLLVLLLYRKCIIITSQCRPCKVISILFILHTALIMFISVFIYSQQILIVFYFFVYYILCIKLLACNRRNNSKLFKQIKMILTEKFIHRLQCFLPCVWSKQSMYTIFICNFQRIINRKK